MKSNKFTFKTTKPTGRYRSFFNPSHDIKLHGKDIGSIVNGTWDIRLMVVKKDIMEDGNPNCNWTRITLNKKSNSLQEAKDFINGAFDVINKKYNLKKD
jgi:hypothetical protein